MYLRQASYQSRVLLFLLNGDNHSVPLDSKEINQSIQQEINHEYSLDGLMLKLKL